MRYLVLIVFLPDLSRDKRPAEFTTSVAPSYSMDGTRLYVLEGDIQFTYQTRNIVHVAVTELKGGKK